MKKLASIILLLWSLAVQAQTDSVILRAMQDELGRNMKDLRYKGFESPFYISYSIKDINQYEVAATLGALLRSNANRNRLKNIRVLVGDYEFNDESLDNNNFSAPEANEIQLPLDDDYYGIRRALWVTTDYIYKSAARQYKKNLETLKEKNKTIAEMPHRTFAKTPVEKIFRSKPAYAFDKINVEKYVKELSAVFSDYPRIEYSTAYLSFVDGYSYFVNSEGSIGITPVSFASLQVFAQRKTTEGETIFDQILNQTFSPDDFPEVEKLKADIKKLCEALSAEPIKVFDDEYSGPVLLVGKPVADMFSSTLFSSRDALIASDVLPDNRGHRQDQSSTIDSKIGKPITGDIINVKARTTLKSFNQTPLMGSYDIDEEGVVPPAELALIENGILKNLLNNRSLIKLSESANGHSSGPGVIDVYLNRSSSLKELKDNLIAEAKKENLEYAIIMSAGSDDPVAGMLMTRVSVADGKEELLRGAFLQPINLKNLKDVLGGSKNQKAFNIQNGAEKRTSFIVPEAILLKDLEVRKAEVRISREEQYVSSPLKK